MPGITLAQIPCGYQILAEITAPPCGLGSVVTRGTAISPDGHIVVGYAQCPLGGPRPFKWTAATGFEYIALPPWLTEAMPADVNDHRIMVGTGVGTVAGQRGWVCDLKTGVWTELLPQNPPTGWSGASGINNNNVVCGARSIGSKGDPVNPLTAFIWTAMEGFTDLGLINTYTTTPLSLSEDGVVAGYSGLNIASSTTRAFIWDGRNLQTFGPVPNGIRSVAWYADASGFALIAGPIVSPTGNVLRTFKYLQAGQSWTELPPLAGDTYTLATRVSASGLIGGVSRIVTPGLIDHACLWVDGEPHAVSERVTLPVGYSMAGLIDIARDTDQLLVAGSSQTSSIAMLLKPTANAPGNTNCDDLVNVADLLNVIVHWGPCEGCSTDLTDDGVVDHFDLIEVVTHWG
jgi:uncharacterized membrane protein